MRATEFDGGSRGNAIARFVIAVLLLVAGFAAGRLTAPRSDAPLGEDPNTSNSATDGGGPRSVRDGVPVGYARTEEGAIQAAINYSRAMGPDPGESKDAYAAKLHAIASDEWTEQQSTIDSWSEGEAEAAPLRLRVIDFSEDRAEVALWFASLINPRNGSPNAVWGRAFITLVWEDNDWKVAAEDGEVGPWPTPASGPSSSADFTELLSQFESIDYEPASLP